MIRFETKNKELTPKRATKYSAGYDFIAPKDYVVPAHGTCVIESEVAIELSGFDSSKVLMLFVRSSYGFKYGVTLANGTGIVDADFYPNTIKCKLKNDSDNDLIIKKGDRYMQGIILDYYTTNEENNEVEAIRTSGFGSTGK